MNKGEDIKKSRCRKVRLPMLLYHGTLDFAAVMIMERKHFIHSDGTKHLLGKGIYLYDEMDLAYACAKKQTEIHNRKNSPVLPYKPVVLKVEVDVKEEQYLNLDSMEMQNLFFSARQNFKEKLRQYGLITKVYTDSLFCDFLCHKLDVKLLSKTMTDSTYSEGIPPQMKQKMEAYDFRTMHFPTEKHYCLKDTTWICNISYGRVGDL